MTLLGMYRTLLELYGHRCWWPAETIDEIVIGAILTQNVSWSNAAKAIAALKAENLLSMAAIYRSSAESIARLIVPTRYYNQKAQKLKNFAEFYQKHFNGSYDEMFKCCAASLRKQLLQVKGIGRETADSILLYAGSKPQFVSDAYTARLLGRLGLVQPNSTYEEIVHFAEEQTVSDAELYKDIHAQIVHFSAVICRSKPLCGDCPLKSGCRHYKEFDFSRLQAGDVYGLQQTDG